MSGLQIKKQDWGGLLLEKLFISQIYLDFAELVGKIKIIMTWAYINLYLFDSVEWIINFSWILSITTLILTSFLNLLSEIAETFSIVLLMTLVCLPQITLLVVIHNTNKSLNIGNTFSSLINLTQYKILNVYYTKNLKWITI